MSGIIDTWWLQRDNRDWYACTRYILFKCCKKTKKYKLGQDIPGWERSVMTEYLPIDFLDYKWIIERCNFELSKDFGLDLLPISFLHWYEEAHFVPEYFDTDFGCDYKKDKNNKWRKIKRKEPWKERDFISDADIWAMDKVIRKWKIYGRLSIKLSNSIYKLKRKLTRSK